MLVAFVAVVWSREVAAALTPYMALTAAASAPATPGAGAAPEFLAHTLPIRARIASWYRRSSSVSSASRRMNSSRPSGRTP